MNQIKVTCGDGLWQVIDHLGHSVLDFWGTYNVSTSDLSPSPCTLEVGEVVSETLPCLYHTEWTYLLEQ